MRLKSHASFVFEGMQRRGYSMQQISQILKASPSVMKQFVAGKKQLTFKYATLIEEATGKTPGQFAMTVVEPKGGELTNILNDVAESMRSLRRSELRPRRAAAKA